MLTIAKQSITFPDFHNFITIKCITSYNTTTNKVKSNTKKIPFIHVSFKLQRLQKRKLFCVTSGSSDMSKVALIKVMHERTIFLRQSRAWSAGRIRTHFRPRPCFAASQKPPHETTAEESEAEVGFAESVVTATVSGGVSIATGSRGGGGDDGGGDFGKVS